MFDNTKKQNNEENKELKEKPVVPKEDINQRIERLHTEGKKRGGKKIIIIEILALLIIAGGATASFMYWDKISSFMERNGDDCIAVVIPMRNQDTGECSVFSACDMPSSEWIQDDSCLAVGCPEDAKQCPDGSSVGRIGPNCEFTECPEVLKEEECIEEGAMFSTMPTPTGNSGNECCEGLKEVSAEIDDAAFCINCGDGICKENETEANCSKDCEEEIDISDWKIYRNEKYLYDIKYPKEWHTNIESSEKDFTERGEEKRYMGGDTAWSNYQLPINNYFEHGNFPEDLNLLTLIVYRVEKNISIEEFRGDSVKDTVDVIDIITDNGTPGKQYYIVYTDMPIGEKEIITIFQKDNSMYVFKSNWEMKDIHNKILSTLKFLKDSDGDGLYDDDEVKYGTDINNPDTDGDGFLDGDEVKNGYNPMGEGLL